MGIVRFIKELRGEVFITCPSCKEKVNRDDAAGLRYACPKCGGYFRVKTSNRIKMVADAGSFSPWFDIEADANPLDFPGYEEKIEAAREKTGLNEGVSIGLARIYGQECVLGICDARFLMGSMGSVYGERITAAVERATRMKLPVIIFTCSGGARMQEGIASLMQMAKTSAALKKHSEAGLLYVSVLTDPTTGGVTASFAMLGDVILAEPGALIGFAGPRVIEQTIGEKLPAGFQRAEFLLDHGFVDKIVKREELKDTLFTILKLHEVGREQGSAEKKFEAVFPDGIPAKYKPTEIMKERQLTERPKTAWERVKSARGLERPTTRTMINKIFKDFVEFHGDRQCKDDKAIVGGIASLSGMPVTVVGIQKGNDLAQCQETNFGMSGPEGYRKALRLMKQAEKFGRPVICFINTAGAYPGMEAEERGQGEAIARNLYEMSALTVPVLSIFIGEGGSGGALALAVANEVWMLEDSVYSILSPEGFASILWKDAKRAEEAADLMHITAGELLRMGIADKVIPEYGGANEESATAIAMYIRDKIYPFLQQFDGMSGEEIAAQRYERFRRM